MAMVARLTMGGSVRLTKAVLIPASSVMHRMSRSSSQNSIQLDVINENQGIGEIRLQSRPLNILSRPVLSGLVEGVARLERDGCRALLVTSAVPGVFSAGLDLLEMHEPKEADLRQYWHMVQEMFLRLYSSSLVTVACVTGLARAGGCLVATACDYRLMLDRPAESSVVIGLPESLIGLQVPDWIRMSFSDLVGRRQAALALQMGLLFPGREALRIGLVDQLADTPEQLRRDALQKVEQFLKVPDVGRVPAKRISTAPLVSYLSSGRQKDVDRVVAGLTRGHVPAAIAQFVKEGLESSRDGKNKNK